jgi:tetratricopeptide (TPR) repeat protein
VGGGLQRNEVHRLQELAINELGLDSGTAADIERGVMGDTKETILERQEVAAREEERNRRLEELYNQARRLHRDRKWQAVIDVFEQIHAEDPTYPDPERLLSSSIDAQELEQRVATLYDRGQRHMKAEQWQKALECFEEIQRLVPGYLETEELLARVRQQLTSPPKVEVPDLSGQTLSQAGSSLASKGIRLGVYEEVPSDTIAEGEIIGQSPEPETEVLAGSSVSVTVSSGPHEVSATAPPGDQIPEDTYRRVRPQSLLPALTGSWWAMARTIWTGMAAER